MEADAVRAGIQHWNDRGVLESTPRGDLGRILGKIESCEKLAGGAERLQFSNLIFRGYDLLR